MKLSFLSLVVAITNAFVIPTEQVLTAVAPEINENSNLLSAYNKWIDNLKYNAENVLENIIDTANEFKDEASDFLGTLRPHHPHHEPNETLYEMIKRSKYSTILAKIIDDDEFLIDVFNSTESNITVFVPIDSAFEKLPGFLKKYLKELPKEDLRKIILYHAVPGLYPAGRVLRSKTLPSLYMIDSLSKEPVPQRLAVGTDIRRGFGINYYARLKALNIFGTNGVAHAISAPLLPPPPTIKIIKFLVSEFTTLNLALEKTGFDHKLNETSSHHHHYGGTLFAPPELAWKKLGPKINAFLFSPHGLKYLKALLKYHAVPNHVLYTDAYYTAEDGVVAPPKETKAGLYHLDLPTLLDKKKLSVDVARYGSFTEIKINGFTRVTVPNGIASDGVFQDTSSVLIPPKKVSGSSQGLFWMGEELSVEDLKERLEPYVETDNDNENEEL